MKLTAVRRPVSTPSVPSPKRFPTAKVLMALLFVNCTFVELFTMWATNQSFKLAYATQLAPDLTPLNTLVGTVVAEVLGFAVYCLKSVKENTKGGIVYDSAVGSMPLIDNSNAAE